VAQIFDSTKPAKLLHKMTFNLSDGFNMIAIGNSLIKTYSSKTLYAHNNTVILMEIFHILKIILLILSIKSLLNVLSLFTFFIKTRFLTFFLLRINVFLHL